MNKNTKKVAFYTLGCKVNQYETNAMIQQFINKGYQLVDFNDIADIYVINTCTVTNMSDRKSRQMIKKVKQLNPNSCVVAVGCYAQVAKKELEKIKDIDIILGINEKNNIVNIIEEYKKEKLQQVTNVFNQKEYLDFGIIKHTDKTRAVIKIQDGCDRFCSYCIIPYARGRVRSRKINIIIDEIKQIVDSGIKEIIITGIHIASYGKDLLENVRLIDLLEKINKIENLKRIRLGSLEPTLIDKQFVKRLCNLEKVCNHFHLSLQSGCNETLKRMNRKYSIEEFTESVKLLRNNIKDVNLTTDIIVGFPGETEQEFNKTYDYLRYIKFYKMHIFKYSQRKGTKASQMPDQVQSSIKDKRSNLLINLSNENQKEYNKRYIGKEVDVLLEKQDGEYIKGHTSNYLQVKVTTNNLKLQDTIQRVKIIDIDELELTAVI